MTFLPYSTHVPDGFYSVRYLKFEVGTAFETVRWFGHFRITDLGEYHDLPLLRVWNKPRGKFLARSHNLSRDYMSVVGTLPPANGLKPEDFLADREVLARVATVSDQINGRKRIRLSEPCHYSKRGLPKHVIRLARNE
jgi:hypothetical protein